MKIYRNIFKEKTEDELVLLYKQLLEFDNLGYIPDNELGIIRDEYFEYFKTNTIWVMQIDLMRTISDLWFKNKN